MVWIKIKFMIWVIKCLIVILHSVAMRNNAEFLQKQGEQLIEDLVQHYGGEL